MTVYAIDGQSHLGDLVRRLAHRSDASGTAHFPRGEGPPAGHGTNALPLHARKSLIDGGH